MVFKIDNDIIANALKKEFTKEIPASIGNILRDEIEKKQKETSTKKESDNLSDVKDLFEIKEKKTNIPSLAKLKKAKINKLVFQDAKATEITDKEVTDRIKDKELSINPVKVIVAPVKVPRPKPTTEILSSGKRLSCVDSTLFYSKYEELLENNPIKTNKSYTSDPLREYSGKIWSIDKSSKNFVFTENQNIHQQDLILNHILCLPWF